MITSKVWEGSHSVAQLQNSLHQCNFELPVLKWVISMADSLSFCKYVNLYSQLNRFLQLCNYMLADDF